MSVMPNDFVRPSICVSVCRVDQFYNVFDCTGMIRLFATGDDPITEIGLAYLRTGAPAETPLQVLHCGSDRLWMATTIGAAAGPRFDASNVVPLRRKVKS